MKNTKTMGRFRIYIGVLTAFICLTLFIALNETQTIFDPEYIQILLGIELITLFIAGFEYQRLGLSVKSDPPIATKPTVQSKPVYPRQQQKQRQPKRKPRQSRRKA